MALIICPECGKTISDKAKFCVHCGYPIEDAENTARMPAEDSVMPDWKCPLCGVTNSGSDLTCKVCGFNKPAVPPTSRKSAPPSAYFQQNSLVLHHRPSANSFSAWRRTAATSGN